jgi:hypothetical protein
VQSTFLAQSAQRGQIAQIALKRIKSRPVGEEDDYRHAQCENGIGEEKPTVRARASCAAEIAGATPRRSSTLPHGYS